jgi:hypothetical protein
MSQETPHKNWIDVDVMAPGPFTARERGIFSEWYKAYHGDDNLDSAGFVSFWLDNWDNEVLKGFRRWVEASVQTPAFMPPVLSLVMMHAYTVLGWESGAQYELICALKLCGVKKSHVLESLAFAFIHAGPKGMSQVSRQCNEFLKKWEDNPEVTTPWPRGWAADPQLLKSGIDLRTRGLTPGELEQLKQWYLTHQGEVPSYVPFLARWNPEGLKAFRFRYETAIDTLPPQVVPLMTLNLAAIQGKPGAMRRAAFQARHYGITREQMLPIVQATLAYTGDLGTETTAEALGGIVENW